MTHTPVSALITPQNMHLVTKTVTGIKAVVGKKHDSKDFFTVQYPGFTDCSQCNLHGRIFETTTSPLDLDLTPIIQAEFPPEMWVKGDQIRLIASGEILTFVHRTNRIFYDEYTCHDNTGQEVTVSPSKLVLHARLDKVEEKIEPISPSERVQIMLNAIPNCYITDKKAFGQRAEANRHDDSGLRVLASDIESFMQKKELMHLLAKQPPKSATFDCPHCGKLLIIDK